MLLLSEKDVQEALSMDDVINAVMDAHREYSQKLVDVPSRITMHVRGKSNSAIFLTANYRTMPFYGIKQASSFSTNLDKGKNTVFADIHIYSAESGEPLAMVSANHLTAMKTGAASAVATKFFAKQGDAILAIIGTGVQAQTQLEGIQRIRPLKEVRLYDLDQKRTKEFVHFFQETKNRDYPVIISPSADACINGADIVVTATTSTKPVFSGDHIQKGTHINAIGSFTPFMQEIDGTTVLKASKIVTDNLEETWAVAGDLLVPLGEGQINHSILYGELGDIVSGKIPGRENEDEITIYESVGFAALDIAVAVAAYRKSMELGIGLKVNW